MKQETIIQNKIIVECSDIAHLYNYNVGKFYTLDGRFINVGIKGFSDLFGFRNSDNKTIFIETKTPIGKLRKEQKQFLTAMKQKGNIVGVARNTEQARDIILEKEAHN